MGLFVQGMILPHSADIILPVIFHQCPEGHRHRQYEKKL